MSTTSSSINKNFRTILITGASRGIGLELVKQLLQSNPNRIVYATSRSSSDKLDQLQEQFSIKRLKIEHLDVTNDESIDTLVKNIKDQHVKIDVLVNNAGILKYESVTTSTRDSVAHILHTNTISPLIVSQKFYNGQLFQKNGLIVNITSGLGSISTLSTTKGLRDPVTSSSASVSSYTISKTALNMVTKLQSVSFAEGKVRSLSIHPGWLQTELGGQHAPLSVDVGVAGIVKVIDNFKDEQNGEFLQFDGSPVKW